MKIQTIVAACLCLLQSIQFCQAGLFSGRQESLPRSTPQAEGVSAKGILDFIDAVEHSRHEMHSFMVLRHGKVISEGFWNPYDAGMKNTLYSLSKSFTSTAVGFAVSEKRLTVEDRVVSFFPDQLPKNVSPFLAELKVRDLLTMSTGQFPEPTFTVMMNDTNWVKAFLQWPVVYEPGSKFMYNSLGTYMLSAIVQKVTGQTVKDYLTPRLFTPLGITGEDWETDPRGINTGGWGLRVKTEDVAKFGQFCLQQGKWKDRQLLPASWMVEATSAHIEQEPGLPQSTKDSSDWLQGYGYQFWRCRNHAFRGDGAYGQFMVVMPDQDAVVVIMSESNDLQAELNLVWKYLLPAMGSADLPQNDSSEAALARRSASLALALPVGMQGTDPGRNLPGRIFRMRGRSPQITAMHFEFTGGGCLLKLIAGDSVYPLSFGPGRWIFGETSRIGPNLFLDAKAHLRGLAPFRVAGTYCWKDPETLVLELRYLESPHRETFTCRFTGKKIRVEIEPSNDPVNRKSKLKGSSTR